MYLYVLKFLLALVIIIGKVVYVNNFTHSYTPKYIFNKVADFDDIIEKENDGSPINLEERTPVADTKKHVPVNSRFSTLALPISKSPLRHKSKIHDIKNRESDVTRNSKTFEKNDMSLLNDNFRFQPHLHEKMPRENVFDKPEVYMANDHSPQSGYYIVNEKQPRSNFKKLNDLVKKYKNSKHQSSDEANLISLHDSEKDKERSSDTTINTNGYKTGHCKNCDDVRNLFQIPLLAHILLDAIGDNDVAVVQNNEPLKYVIRKVAPRADTNIFDKPENLRCLRYILKKRRKRHATYVSLRHKAKNRSHLFRRKVDPADVPNNDQYQNIINFIIRNKTFDETYTFVPVVFATVNPGVINPHLSEVTNTQASEIAGHIAEVTGTQVSELVSLQNATELSNATNTICINITHSSSTSNQSNPFSSSTENSSKSGEESTVLQSLNNLAASVNGSNEMQFRVTGFNSSGEPAIENSDLTTNKDLLAARSIAKQLNDVVPQLKRNFAALLKSEQHDRPKKFVSTVVPNEDGLVIPELGSTGTINASSTLQTSVSSSGSSGQETATNTTIPEICLNFISNHGSAFGTTSATSTENPLSSVSTKENLLSSVSTNSELSNSSISTLQSSSIGNVTEINGTIISNTESLLSIPISSISESSTVVAANNSGMFPGILIYPKTKTKRKRLAEDFSNNVADNFVNKFPGLIDDTADLQKASFDKYIDFNPLRKLKKDVSIDCINETNEMLDVLSHLGGGSGSAVTPISFESMEVESSPDQSNIETTCLPVDSVTKNNIETQSFIDIQADVKFNMTEPSSTMHNLIVDQMSELNPNLMPKVDSGVVEKLNSTVSNLRAMIPTSMESVSVTPSVSNTFVEPVSHSVSCFVPTDTSKVKLETTNIPIATSQNPISLSIASIPNILQSQPPLSKAVRKADNSELSAKLKRLESDLKLVNEVQSILNGMSSRDHKISKRETDLQNVHQDGEPANCDETTTLFELNLKVVDQGPLENEIDGLGKLLKWKAKQQKDDCRVRRRARRKKKKKKRRKKKRKEKKLMRRRRFLGLGTQNFP